MKVAYCILCHKLTNPLKFTVNYLSGFDSNKLFIHVDLKSDISPLVEEFKQDNVFFVNDRVNVAWGGVSQVDATLSLLRAAIKEGFDYVFLISGDDIPAVSNGCILEFLGRLKGYEFIAYQDKRFNYVNPHERVKYRYPSCYFKKERSVLEKLQVRAHRLGRRLGLYNNSLYESLPELYKGTQWFTLSYTSVSFILNYLNKTPRYRKAFQDSFCCDEIFFHTILKHAPFFINIYHDAGAYSDCLRYIDWESGPDFPRTLDESDFYRIKESGMLFARKVKTDIDIDSLGFFTDKLPVFAKKRLIYEEID